MEISRTDLLAKLDLLGLVAKQETFMPNRTLVFHDDVLSSYTSLCAMHIPQEGFDAPVSVDFDMFKTCLKNMPSEDVQLIVTDRLVMQKKQTKYSIPLLEYPSEILPSYEKQPATETKLPERFGEQLEEVQLCCCKSDSSLLNCVHLSPTVMEATNRVLLHRIVGDFSAFHSNAFLKGTLVKAILPFASNVSWEKGEKGPAPWIWFSSDLGCVQIRTLEGYYPNTSGILVKNPEYIVFPEEIREVMKRIYSISKECAVTLCLSEGSVTIQATAHDGMVLNDSIKMEYAGESRTISCMIANLMRVFSKGLSVEYKESQHILQVTGDNWHFLAMLLI